MHSESLEAFWLPSDFGVRKRSNPSSTVVAALSPKCWPLPLALSLLLYPVHLSCQGETPSLSRFSQRPTFAPPVHGSRPQLRGSVQAAAPRGAVRAAAASFGFRRRRDLRASTRPSHHSTQLQRSGFCCFSSTSQNHLFLLCVADPYSSTCSSQRMNTHARALSHTRARALSHTHARAQSERGRDRESDHTDQDQDRDSGNV